jgi:hypothetical protein
MPGALQGIREVACPLPPESLNTPFLKFTLAHRIRQNRWPNLGVGLQPNTACELQKGRLSLRRNDGNASFANAWRGLVIRS